MSDEEPEESPELDEEACLQIFKEMLSEHGTRVFSNWADVDGLGSGGMYIVEYGGYYFNDGDDFDLTGPYDSLEEALERGYATEFGGGEITISSPLMSSEQIVPFLSPYYIPDDEPYEILINEERWQVGTDGEITRATDAGGKP